MKLKKAFLGLMILIGGVLVWQYDLISYGWMQARGQVKVILEAQPIEQFYQREDFPDSLKIKLKLIGEVGRFSSEALGLDNSDNYRTLFDQKGKDILWNLTACQPFRLEAKEWSFPLLGSFSYKGFFDLEKAKKEQQQLQEEGFDTVIRPVNGWSTLGWFDDPILSNMLGRPEGQLAKLIIHELTHGTLYIRDSVGFNENLATFIGEKGAEKFLSLKYGRESTEYLEYIRNESDLKKYTEHFIRGAFLLDSLYNSSALETAGFEEKLRMKEQLIRSIVVNLDTINFNTPQKFRSRFGENLPNNAYFMSFLRYHSKQDVLEKDCQENFGGDIKSYLDHLKEKYSSL